MPEARPAGDEVNYDHLFPARFAQPSTYIRFSSTVEDCTGVSYCMDDEDVKFLTQLNVKHKSQQSPRKRRGAAQPDAETRECSEAWFEQLMTSFEETSAARQPFASVDHPPVLPFEELAAAFDDEVVDEGARSFAREIYEHWKSRRAERGDQRLMSQLKTPRIDANGSQDADDNDPFVCFRRREFRQARKTRGRDAQVIEKLKRLRKELEDGRVLLDLVRKREASHKDHLQLNRELFESRHKFRRVKQENKITEDDEKLLVDQKPQEPKIRQPQPPINTGPVRPRLPEQENPDVVDLGVKIAERVREVNRQIAESVQAHDKWNRHFIDNTENALLGMIQPTDMFLSDNQQSSAQGRGFIGVKIEQKGVPKQLPTPPDSVADSQSEKSVVEEDHGATGPEEVEQQVQWANSSDYPSFKSQGRFRKRTGRGGRVMLDRHNFRTRHREEINDRFQFDCDSGDEESWGKLELDKIDIMDMRVQFSGGGGQSQARRSSSGSHGPRESQISQPQQAQGALPGQPRVSASG